MNFSVNTSYYSARSWGKIFSIGLLYSALLVCISPFLNNFFLSIYGVNFTAVSVVVNLFFLVLNISRMFEKYSGIHIAIVIASIALFFYQLFLFFVYSGERYHDLFSFLRILLVSLSAISLRVLSYDVILRVLTKLSGILLIIVFLVFYKSNFLDIYRTGSRMSYLVNPISLSILVGFIFFTVISKPGNKTAMLPVLGLLLGMMIFTGSKGPIVALLLTLLLKCNNVFSLIKSLFLLLFFLFLFVLSLNVFSDGYVIDNVLLTRLYDYEVFKNQSFLSRLDVYATGAEIALLNPFGLGPDGYLLNGGVYGSPHNIFLEVIINFGVVIAVPVVLFFLVLMYKTVGSFKPLGTIGFYFLVCGQFSVGFTMIPVVLFFFYLELFCNSGSVKS